MADYFDYRFDNSHWLIAILSIGNAALGVASAYVPFYKPYMDSFLNIGIPRGQRDGGTTLHYDSVVSHSTWEDQTSGAWAIVGTAAASGILIQHGTQLMANPKNNGYKLLGLLEVGLATYLNIVGYNVHNSAFGITNTQGVVEDFTYSVKQAGEWHGYDNGYYVTCFSNPRHNATNCPIGQTNNGTRTLDENAHYGSDNYLTHLSDQGRLGLAVGAAVVMAAAMLLMNRSAFKQEVSEQNLKSSGRCCNRPACCLGSRRHKGRATELGSKVGYGTVQDDLESQVAQSSASRSVPTLGQAD